MSSAAVVIGALRVEMKMAEMLSLNAHRYHLKLWHVSTVNPYFLEVDISTIIYWMSPLVILGMSGPFDCFNSIFDGKS